MADQLKQQRANTKKSISRIKNIVEANGKGEGKALTPIELKCRLGILESYFHQISSYQTQIEKVDHNDNGRAEIEDLYISVKSAIHEQLGEDLHNSTMRENILVGHGPSSRLPPLKLPTFDGKYSEFKNFITSFNQIIDREICVTNIEKFNHLLSCLQGQALETVKAFQVTNENYPKALERLKLRYDNSTLIFLEDIASLFELPATKQNSTQIRRLVDNVAAIYSSLQSLGSDKDISNAMLIHIVMQKVDEATQRKWKESLDFTRLPTWEECAKVLDRHCQFLTSIESSHSVHDNAHRGDNKSSRKSEKHQPQQKNFSFACTKRMCTICAQPDHAINNCQQFANMTVATRFEKAKNLGLCINCLSKNHKVTQCTSAFKCKVCARSHHTLLHRNQTTTATPPSMPSKPLHTPSPLEQPVSPGTSASTHTHLQGSASKDAVILATAIVLVKDSSGCYQLGRALLDSCSQVNFITEDFLQRLRLSRERHNMQILSIGESASKIKHKSSTSIKSRFNDFELALSFCVTTNISYQPEAEIDISSWRLPANISLADEHFFKSKRIDLLLGTESFFDILSVGQIKLGTNLPTLQKTLLGWVVSGKYKSSSTLPQQSKTFFLSNEESINFNLEQLWKLDEISSKTTLSEEQSDCEVLFKKSVSRSHDGRIIVRLPFKEPATSLGLSHDTALRRFASQERRLARDPELRAQYSSFMQEYEDLGHMTLAKVPIHDTPHYYIPHHFVLQPKSTSTKLRVVFDASCRTSTQKSLNDLLMVGATIQDDLLTLLLRFRLHRYVITADIVKMYRQVLIDSRDRCFQYIVWRNANNKQVQTYQLNTVTYGTAAAPFLAVRSLHYLADQYTSEFALGSSVIKSSFYVDDLLCGADTVDELAQIKHEVSSILKKGCFELAKWHSNVNSLIDDSSLKEINLRESSISSALGIRWDQNHDVFLFFFTPKNLHQGKSTKRSILSIASSLFDPLGLLAPLLVTAKIILQELWLLKLDWDESVPQGVHSTWESMMKELQSLDSIRIPRYCLQANAKGIQLHGFCDASIRAYGCCIYYRVENAAGDVTVHLFTAKSRIAPTKKKSLPKLELCAAQLLAKLIAKTKEIINCFEFDIYLWSDSQIVLHWLRMHSSTLSTFVGNRVSEIQELTNGGCQWRFVPTQDNPADIVSRGCNVQHLIESIWLIGPSYLRYPESQWPANCHPTLDWDEINKERCKSAFLATRSTNYLIERLEKFSSHLTAVRVVAWMLRFYQKLRSPNSRQESTQITPQNLETALWCIVWNLQQQHFREDIGRAKKGAPAQDALKYLNPFLDEVCNFKLLKVGGRLELSSMPESQKHPVLLPSKCHFVRSLVRHLHLSNYHAGPKALVALIRLRFWIINARDIARRTVRSCIHCVRYKPKLLQQVMGNLPVERLTPCRPFSRCAVDFCGPVSTYVRIRGKRPYKTYIAIFVCLWSKAVHIEVVSDLSTDAFIAALKRLIGRRGLATDIFCDNATNFVGASRKLAELKEFLFSHKNQNIITNFCTNEFVNFTFIPPRAPHFGGLWEAAVKAAKGHLNRTLDNTRLTFEELATALVEIEAILNSRPLSPLSSDPSDYETLTPAHFIIGCSLKALPERTVSEPKDISHLECWARISAVKQRFWQHWYREYVSELQFRTKWQNAQPNVHIDCLVLIHEDHTPPQRWVCGRVVAVIPGKDNKVRVVDVKTPKGILRRPIHKLALLPVERCFNGAGMLEPK